MSMVVAMAESRVNEAGAKRQMSWVIASTGAPYSGDTHEFLGTTYSGKTRTTESRRLEWVEETPKPVVVSKPKQPRAKAAPKPKGATAWD